MKNTNIQQKTFLKIFLSLLVFRILLSLTNISFDKFIPEGIHTLIPILYVLSTVLSLGFLYYFVKIIKGQAFSLLLLIFIILAKIVNLFANSYILSVPESVFYIMGFNGIVLFILSLILGIQLILNKAEDLVKKDIKFVGISILVMIGITTISNAIQMFFIDYLYSNLANYVKVENIITSLIFLLPFIAMIILCTNEIKRINLSSTDL